MEDIRRIPASGLNVPKIQRKIPKPYQRSSITVTDASRRRLWQTVPAQNIKIGDTLPGIGQVTSVDHSRGEGIVTIRGGDGNVKTHQSNELIWAFCA